MPAPTNWIPSIGFNSSFKAGDSRWYVNIPVQGWVTEEDGDTVARDKAENLTGILGSHSYALPTVLTETFARASDGNVPQNSLGRINETLRFLCTSPTGTTGQAIIRIPEYAGFTSQANYDTFIALVAQYVRLFTPDDSVQFLG